MERAWTTPSPMMKEEKSKSVLNPGEPQRQDAPKPVAETPKPAAEAPKPAAEPAKV
jgi:hypothetical protein